MDRRTFVQTGLSSLLTYSCGFAHARAGTDPRGCRLMAAKAGDSLGVTILEHPCKYPKSADEVRALQEWQGGKLAPKPPLTLRDTKTPLSLADIAQPFPCLPSADPRYLVTNKAELLIDESYLRYAERMIAPFGVRPGISYYDDIGSPNALADPLAIFPDGPDGTILLGINLITEEKDKRYSPELGVDPYTITGPVTIMAHEFGHILQFKLGMNLLGPKVELHADFMAGWYLGLPPDKDTNEFIRDKGYDKSEVGSAMKALFEKGDYAYNAADHHGTPEQRAETVRAGYDVGLGRGDRALDAKQAFEEGKKVVGIS